MTKKNFHQLVSELMEALSEAIESEENEQEEEVK